MNNVPTDRAGPYRGIFRIAVAIAAAPIAIAAIRNGLAGWYPVGDAAYTAVRVTDVFSAHPPLIGLPALPGQATDAPYHFIGALHLYLLAVPVRVLGVSWGLLIGMAAINTAWFVMALWLIRRRVGYRVGLIATLFGVTLLWSLGSQLLVDVTPARSGVLAFLTLLASAWSVADVDEKALVPLAASSSYLLLTQFMYSIVVPIIACIALGLWLNNLRALRRNSQDNWPELRSRHRHHFAWSAALTALAWSLPILENIITPNGNLGKIVASLGRISSRATHEFHRTITDAIGVASSPLTTWPLWFRNSVDNPHFNYLGPQTSFIVESLGIAVVLALSVIVLWTARKRRDRTILSGMSVGVAAWLGWIISARLNPSPFGYYIVYFRPLWPMSMFIWLVLTIGLLRSRTTRSTEEAIRPFAAPAALAVVSIGLVALLSIPYANFGSATRSSRVPVARAIRSAVQHDVPRDETVLLTRAYIYGGAYLPVIALALNEEGIPFRANDPWLLQLFGANRAYKAQSAATIRTLKFTTAPLSDPSWNLLWRGSAMDGEPSKKLWLYEKELGAAR